MIHHECQDSPDAGCGAGSLPKGVHVLVVVMNEEVRLRVELVVDGLRVVYHIIRLSTWHYNRTR